MTITPPIIAAIIARLRNPKMPKLNQAQLAEHMGYGRSWASKLMKGAIKNISDEDTAHEGVVGGVAPEKSSHRGVIPFRLERRQRLHEIVTCFGRHCLPRIRKKMRRHTSNGSLTALGLDSCDQGFAKLT